MRAQIVATRIQMTPSMAALPLFAAAMLAIAAPVRGQDVITSHGISTFGDLKYGPDFPHFDYVNPDVEIPCEVMTSC
ncbi:MAG: hypothetical protein HUJ24_11220, partial [Rhodobacteraceae bacterium]|nr:hypothetical protein [Paracoccaceae bacterium]